MRTGRPTTPIELSEQEEGTLKGWTRRLKSAQALALRSRIVLLCADRRTNSEVAGLLRVTKQTVGKWRGRFLLRRLDGLLDEPRPGAPRRIADEEIEAVVTRTLESMPRNATHWSTRSMAEASGLSHMTVKRIWGAFGLEPHRVETFKLSTDPLFVDKVRDIVGLYLAPLRANISETFLTAQNREQGEKEMKHDRRLEAWFCRDGICGPGSNTEGEAAHFQCPL